MKTLFNDYPLQEYLSYRDEIIKKEVSSLKEDSEHKIDEIAEKYAKKYKINVPKLRLEKKKIDFTTGERPENTFSPSSGINKNDMYLSINVTCIIPFKGEEELLYCIPPAYFSQKPCGIVNDQKIYIKVWREYADLNFTHEETDDAKREIESMILKLRKYLKQIEIFTQDYNENLYKKITNFLKENTTTKA